MRKRIAIVSLLVLFVGAYSAKDSILHAAVQWYLKSSSAEWLGSQLSYNSITFEKGAWVLNNPTITTSTSLEKGGYVLSADKALLTMAFNFLKREVQIVLSIEALKGEVGYGANSIKKLIGSHRRTFHFFHPHLQLEIPYGVIQLHEERSNNNSLPSIYFSMQMSAREKEPLQAVLHLQESPSENKKIALLLKSGSLPKLDCLFDQIDLAKFAPLFKTLLPNYAEFDILQGEGYGAIQVFFPLNNPPYAEGKLELNQLCLFQPSQQCTIQIPSLALSLLSTSSSQHPMQTTIEGRIPEEAAVYFFQRSQPSCSIRHIKGELKIENFDHANVKIEGEWVREASTKWMSVEIDLNLRQQHDFSFKLSLPDEQHLERSAGHGSTRQKSELAFLYLSRGEFHLPFTEPLKVIATGHAYSKGLQMAGSLFIGDDSVEHSIQEIAFGCSLDRSPESLENVSSLFTNGFQISQGWFEAKQLPLEKYLSPLIFKEGQIKLSGIGNFQGSFDSQRMVIHYDAKDLRLESDNFFIEVDELKAEKDFHINSCAFHCFDFDRQVCFGTLPIENGKYFEKNSGLLFTEIKAQIALEEQMLHATNVEAFSDGIYFLGNIDANWSDPKEGVFELDLSIAEMHAKFSHVRHFFSHFKEPPFFLKLPIEGNLTLNPGGGYLHFRFTQEDYLLQSHFTGELCEGVLNCLSADLSLKQLGLNFDYDHASHQMEFSNIQGALLLGKPHHIEEFLLTGDKIRFSDIVKNESIFDLLLSDKTQPVLRLAGRTRSICDPLGYPVIEIAFNPSLCHFGTLQPTLFQMTMKDWLQVNSLHFQCAFSLKSLFKDLQRFSDTGFFFLSRCMIKGLQELKGVEGECNAQFSYDGAAPLFGYNLEGIGVVLQGHKFKHFNLTGTKRDSTWSIGQLQLDDLSLAVDLKKESEQWNINFLGARFGDSLLAGLEGKYNAETSSLETRINLLEIEISKLKEWHVLQPLVEKFQLAGFIRATGHCNLQLDQSLHPEQTMDLQLNASVRGGKIQHLHLQDMEQVALKYQSKGCFTISNIRTGIKSDRAGELLAALSLENIQADLIHKKICLEGFEYSIPVQHLQWATEALQATFPAVMTPTVATFFCGLKEQGHLSGRMKLDLSPTNWNLHMRLREGVYRLLNHEIELHNFTLNTHPLTTELNFNCRYGRQPIHIEFSSESPTFAAGELRLFSSEDNTLAPLIVEWEKDLRQGTPFIKKMQGSFSGISLELINDPQASASDSFVLKGEAKIDLSQIHALLDVEQAQKLAYWQAGSGFSLNGTWTLKKEPLCTLHDALSFQGEFLGKQFECFGYIFDKMQAEMHCSKDQVNIKHLHIEDAVGAVQIEKASFSKDRTGLWQASIPLINIEQLRPFLLFPFENAPKTADKALIIRYMQLRSIQGQVNNCATFSATGNLLFSHTQKQAQLHPLFNIPTEILARIGLDVDILNPVKGKIEFHIKDKKLFFDRMKDVYSKGHLTKFYLVNNGDPSYVDFDGNLHMQFRLKQYNFLFKLAELFTVTVEGTFKNPEFILQKQQRNDESVPKSKSAQ